MRDYVEQWELVIHEPLEGGTVSAVIGATRHDADVVLKIHPPWVPPAVPHKTSAETEAVAFTIWDGHTAPRLWKSDAHALLLERIVDARHSPSMDAADMTQLVACIDRPVPSQVVKMGVPPIRFELQKRYQRAAAKGSPYVSGTMLYNACGAAMSLSERPLPDRLNFPHGGSLVHGDLKIKNILERPDGSKYVIDPSPAYGNRLYDCTLWTIDKPEGIAERCDEVADHLEINPKIVGNLAVSLAVSEVCLASPKRAAATIESIKEMIGTNDLEQYFLDDQVYIDCYNAYYEPQQSYKRKGA